jgi:hypothetical protein
MNTQQHLWSMTAIVSTLLLGNLAVGLVNAQQEAPVPEVVTAQEFRVVNKRGQIVATMGSDIDGRPRIALIDDVTTPGSRRLEMKTDEAGRPTVQLNDAGNQPRLRLTCVESKGDDAVPLIQILNGQNKVLGNMGMNANGEPDFRILGRNGQNLELKVDRVSISGGTSDPRNTTLSVAAKGQVGLTFTGENGKWFWTAPPRQRAKSTRRSRR